jgi:hypothetical protein
LRVQLCINLEEMPVEDASNAWDEAKSAYVTVARLNVPEQESWSETLRQAVDDGMAFSPWNGLAAQPTARFDYAGETPRLSRVRQLSARKERLSFSR